MVQYVVFHILTDDFTIAFWWSQMASECPRWCQNVPDHCIHASESWSVEFKDHAMNSIIVLWTRSSFNASNDIRKCWIPAEESAADELIIKWVDVKQKHNHCLGSHAGIICVSYRYIFYPNASACRGSHGIKGWWVSDTFRVPVSH